MTFEATHEKKSGKRQFDVTNYVTQADWIRDRIMELVTVEEMTAKDAKVQAQKDWYPHSQYADCTSFSRVPVLVVLW